MSKIDLCEMPKCIDRGEVPGFDLGPFPPNHAPLPLRHGATIECISTDSY